MTDYKNLLEGAEGLLGDCVNILSNIDKEYVIVGGWSPLLLNSYPIKHPGTHDVDLLFPDGEKPGQLEEVFKLFLKNGYMISAKHNFQLLKVLNVLGEKFVYNVDILHSSDNSDKKDMFVDHLRLPIPLNDYQDGMYLEKSIKAPNSDVLFSEKLLQNVKKKFMLPNGEEKEISFPLINEAGLIITKTESVKNVKRKRDAFDIYIAITQAQNQQNLVSTFKRLKVEKPELFNTLYGIREAMDKYDMIPNIYEYVFGNQYVKDGKEIIENHLNGFLSDVGLEKKAKRFYI